MTFKAIRLDSGTGLSATFVPEAGMIGISLIEDGEELLLSLIHISEPTRPY